MRWPGPPGGGAAPQRSALHPSSPPVTMTMQCSPATDARSSAAACTARPGFRGPRPSPDAASRAAANSPPPPLPETQPAHRSSRTRPRPRPGRAIRPAGRPEAGRGKPRARPRMTRLHRPEPGRAPAGRRRSPCPRAPAANGSPGSPRREVRRPASGGATGASGGRLGGLQRRDAPGFSGIGAVRGDGEPLQFGLEGRVPAQQIRREKDHDRRNGETRPDRAPPCASATHRASFTRGTPRRSSGTPGRTRTVADSPRITFPGGPPFTLRTFFLLVYATSTSRSARAPLCQAATAPAARIASSGGCAPAPLSTTCAPG